MTSIHPVPCAHVPELPLDLWRKIAIHCDAEATANLGHVSGRLREVSQEALAAQNWSPYEHLALRRPKCLGAMLHKMHPAQRSSFAALAHAQRQQTHQIGESADDPQRALADAIAERNATRVEAICKRHLLNLDAPLMAQDVPCRRLNLRLIFEGGLTPLQTALVPHRHSAALIVETLVAHGADVHDHEGCVRLVFRGTRLGVSAWDRAVGSADWYALHSLARAARKPPPPEGVPSMLELILSQRDLPPVLQPLRPRWQKLHDEVQSHERGSWVGLALRVCAETIVMQDAQAACDVRQAAVEAQVYRDLERLVPSRFHALTGVSDRKLDVQALLDTLPPPQLDILDAPEAKQAAMFAHQQKFLALGAVLTRLDRAQPLHLGELSMVYDELPIEAARTCYKGVPAVLIRRFSKQDARVDPAIDFLCLRAGLSRQDFISNEM